MGADSYLEICRGCKHVDTPRNFIHPGGMVYCPKCTSREIVKKQQWDEEQRKYFEAAHEHAAHPTEPRP